MLETKAKNVTPGAGVPLLGTNHMMSVCEQFVIKSQKKLSRIYSQEDLKIYPLESSLFFPMASPIIILISNKRT